MARTLDPAEAPALPLSVRELVARRLDRLGARSQELVGVAAVIGRRFDFLLLLAAGGGDERETAAGVEEMVRHRVLQAVGTQLDFTHDRIREVAYARLLPPRRILLHRAVAEALEKQTQPEHGRGEQIEQLAHHSLHGDLRDKAVRYLRQAGARAAERSALPEARVWLEQALDVAGTLVESRSSLEECFEVRLALRPLLSQLGQFRRALQILSEAEALAERLHDDHRRGRVCAFLANIHARLDEPDEALAHGERALRISERLGDPRLRILATTYLVQAHFYRGEYARVVELATGNIATLPPDWVHEFFGSTQPVSVNDRFRALVSLANLGRFAEAAALEGEVVRLAEETGHAYAVALAYHAASMLYLVKGDWTRARGLIERQIAELRRGSIVAELPMALAFAARALAHLGEATEALGRIQECERLLDDAPSSERGGYTSTYYSLGRACLMLNRVDEAQRLADRAARSVSGRTDYVPVILHLLGDIEARPDRFSAERAQTHYGEALALAESRGMRPLIAHCHAGLGALHRRMREREKARQHLATAIGMYREMGMTYWLESLEVAMAP